MVLYMTEVDEVVYTGEPCFQKNAEQTLRALSHWNSETPEYGSENFMSDVGGTAGLILGMSFATIVGLIDIFIQYAIRMIWLPFEKAKELFKSLDWDYFKKIFYCTENLEDIPRPLRASWSIRFLGLVEITQNNF